MKNLKELIQQIEEVEGVKLSISVPPQLKTTEKIFNDYPYTTPISGNKTVDDLMSERVYPVLYSVKLPESNIVYLHNNLITGFNNLNQMLQWFMEECKELSNNEKIELMCLYEDTYVAELIKKTMVKKKKRTKKILNENPNI